MSEETLTCPKCSGQGGSNGIICPGGFIRYIRCPQCRGSGRVSGSLESQIKAGQELRESRLAQDLSLREMAKKMQISPVELSDMEHGRIPIEDWSIVVKDLSNEFGRGSLASQTKLS